MPSLLSLCLSLFSITEKFEFFFYILGPFCLSFFKYTWRPDSNVPAVFLSRTKAAVRLWVARSVSRSISWCSSRTRMWLAVWPTPVGVGGDWHWCEGGRRCQSATGAPQPTQARKICKKKYLNLLSVTLRQGFFSDTFPASSYNHRYIQLICR